MDLASQKGQWDDELSQEANAVQVPTPLHPGGGEPPLLLTLPVVPGDLECHCKVSWVDSAPVVPAEWPPPTNGHTPWHTLKLELALSM